MLIYIVLVFFVPSVLGENATTEQNDILYKRTDMVLINIKILTRNGTEEVISYNIPQSKLNELNMTKEQFSKSYVKWNDKGYNEIFLPNGDRRPIEVAFEQIIKFHNQKGLSTFSMSRSGFERRTMEDLKNDTSLRPDNIPKVIWPQIKQCNIHKASINVTSLSVSILMDGEELYNSSLSSFNRTSKVWWIGQGLIMIVVNPNNCQVTLQNLVPTSDFGAYRDLDWVLDSISDGRLILLTSLRDGSLRLQSARPHLKFLGSMYAEFYLYKDGWTNVFTKGGRSHLEVLVPNVGSFSNSSSSHNAEIYFSNTTEANPGCTEWPKSERWDKRKIFCEIYDGFGDLCSCKNPFELVSRNKTDAWNASKDIPILVMAGNRTRHLFRMLQSIGKQSRVYKDNFLLSMDRDINQTLQLAEILDLQVIMHRQNGNGSSRIASNLRFGLYNALEMFPWAQQLIVLEDDLVLSPDFYRYMQYLSPIFEMDKSIFCVSAFNHLAYPHTSKDPSLIYRVQTYPAYGWMMSRKIFEEILPKFLPGMIQQDWDYFIGSDLVRRQREILIPDVNRAMHWGTQGMHVQASYYSERLYLSRYINKDPEVNLIDLKSLVKDTYESEFEKMIQNATVLTVDDISNFQIPKEKKGIYKMFVKAKSASDDSTFKVVGENLKIWNMDMRDAHNGAWRLHFNDSILFIIGVPYSKYMKYMPENSEYTTATEEGIKDLKEQQAYAHMNIPIITHENFVFLPSPDATPELRGTRIPLVTTNSSTIEFLNMHNDHQKFSLPNQDSLMTNLISDNVLKEKSKKTDFSDEILKQPKPKEFLPTEMNFREKTTPLPKMRNQKRNFKRIGSSFGSSENFDI